VLLLDAWSCLVLLKALEHTRQVWLLQALCRVLQHLLARRSRLALG
jgi:hypothetical protein